jgi:hypothetical protein
VPEELETPIPNSFDDFIDRFDALSHEAHGYGIDVLIVLRELDRLTKGNSSDNFIANAGVEARRIGYNSGEVLSLGMAEWAAEWIRIKMFSPEDDDD